MTNASASFALLQPKCLELSKHALRQTNELSAEIPRLLENLLETLKDVQGDLSPRLADIVLVPISQVLKSYDRLSDRALELVFLSLGLLVNHGWVPAISEQVGTQLLVLLTFVIGGKPGRRGEINVRGSEECRSAGLLCLQSILDSLTKGNTVAALLEDKWRLNIVQLVTIALKEIQSANSTALQCASAHLLTFLFNQVLIRGDVLASFLPGTVSTLSKVLAKSGPKRHSRTIVANLRLMTCVICHTFPDDDLINTSSDSKRPGEFDVERTQSWRDGSKHQIKTALEGILHHRNHAVENVRKEIAIMSSEILCQCSLMLDNCNLLFVETLLAICADTSSNVSSLAKTEFSRARLKSSKAADFDVLLQECMYDWIKKLPTILVSNDESKKIQILARLMVGLRLVQSPSEFVLEKLPNQLLQALTSPMPKIQTVTSLRTKLLLDEQANFKDTSVLLILPAENLEMSVMESIERCLQDMAQASSSLNMARDLLDRVGDFSRGDEWSLWVAVRILSGCLKISTDEWLDLPNEMLTSIMADLYTTSFDILTGATNRQLDHSLMWEAHALQGLSVVARYEGRNFQSHLIDVLYPVVHLLTHDLETIRLQARACLGDFANSCGCHSLTDLMLQNVDYLVNAVALRLNSFDVSANAPLVLLVLIKINGKSIIPFLDDIVESLFLALENYHGYVKLTETIFQVLATIVETSYQEQRAIDRMRPTRKHHVSFMTDEQLEQALDRLLNPPKPKLQEIDEDGLAMQINEPQQRVPPIINKEIFAIVKRIASVSQHFLTSPSAELKGRLLALIRDSFPVLAADENQFLPLINEIWPVLLQRIHDPESFLVNDTFKTIAIMCDYSGDFMASRINKAWPSFKEIYQKECSGRKSKEKYSRVEEFLQSFSSAMACIIESTWVDEVVFDEVLDLLKARLQKDPTLRKSFDLVNPDAVWLVLDAPHQSFTPIPKSPLELLPITPYL